MTILTAKHAGFCNGVRRAMNMALQAAEEARRNGIQIASLGELIHNGEVIRMLEENGIHAVDTVAEAPEGVLLFRSHGEPPQAYTEAEQRGLQVIDCTCPSVKHLHEIVKEHSDRGKPVIMMGDKGHP